MVHITCPSSYHSLVATGLRENSPHGTCDLVTGFTAGEGIAGVEPVATLNLSRVAAMVDGQRATPSMQG
jgi:hypothetical protein